DACPTIYHDAGRWRAHGWCCGARSTSLEPDEQVVEGGEEALAVVRQTGDDVAQVLRRQRGEGGDQERIVLARHPDDRDEPTGEVWHVAAPSERRDDAIAAGFGELRLQNRDERQRTAGSRDRIVEHVKLAHRP